MVQLDIGMSKVTYPMEELLLQDCFMQGSQGKLFSLAVPMKTDVCVFAQNYLSQQGPTMVYRLVGDGRDDEAFERQLVYFLRRHHGPTVADFQDCIEVLRQESPYYIVLGQAHLLETCPALWNMVLALLESSDRQVQFVILSAQPIGFSSQAHGLPLETVSGDARVLVLDKDLAEQYLQRAYPALLAYDRQRIYHLSVAGSVPWRGWWAVSIT